ncbi:MAG: tRNA (N6-isopentenyl adenosine(37)-C2)-methylthiotransferase MiaB, partial [Robiginitalea sp.]
MEKIIKEELQGSTLELKGRDANTRKLYIESYGCQMNFSDSEIVASILTGEGFNTSRQLDEADLILYISCSIREKAELTV